MGNPSNITISDNQFLNNPMSKSKFKEKLENTLWDSLVLVEGQTHRSMEQKKRAQK